MCIRRSGRNRSGIEMVSSSWGEINVYSSACLEEFAGLSSVA